MFHTAEFAVLVLLSFSGVWLLRERRLARTALLTVLSYLFFLTTNTAHPFAVLYPEIYTPFRIICITFGLLFFSSSLDFYIGKKLKDTTAPKRTRKRLLLLSVLTNLTLLSIFKYCDFFVAELSSLFGIKRFEGAHLLFPIGISFYTFQSISYIVDVYRRRIAPTERYFTYLLYLAFFPQLVMGPIVRAEVLIPQLENRPALSADIGSAAVARIGIGIIKKLAVADVLRVHIVDPVFTNPEMYSSVEVLTAIYGYAFQIWADFSGYTDMAIGTAALLGITLPENFNTPYRARNLREFWQRWHITLSTWLRDYLYIPLGGSRRSKGRTYVNLMITMVLGGLWHGAGTTFLIWGAIHGAALVATHMARGSTTLKNIAFPGKSMLSTVVTFHVVSAAWVFFRAPSYGLAEDVFRGLFSFDFGIQNIPAAAAAALAGGVALHFTPSRVCEKAKEAFKQLPAPVQAALLVVTIYLAKAAADTQVAPFIYAQY